MKPNWTLDTACSKREPIWYLEYDFGYYVAGKSAGGDWYCGWNPNGSPCITDETFDYRDTLDKAKKYCESLNFHKVTAPSKSTN